MGLLDKIVNQTWSTNNKKLYTNKGYVFTHYKDVFDVKVEDLSDGSNVQVKIKCDGCCKGSDEEWKIPWNNYKKSMRENGEYYCKKCSNSLFVAPFLRLTDNNVKEIIHKSLGRHWIINQIKIDPISNKTLVDLIDENKYWYGNVSTNSVQQGHIPFKFHQSNTFVIKNINYFLELNNRKYRLLENNQYKNNTKKMKWICFYCKRTFEANFANIQQQPNYQCPHCGDNVSYPNKLFRAMLEQLNDDYIPEYNPDWIKPKRYDFKLSKEYIVEMDGGLGHGKKNTLNGQTKEETKAIDDYKDEEALKHNTYVIRIDSTKSDLEFIKNNIMNSLLPSILNFKESDINWQKCHEYACKSLVKVVCDLWNEGLNNTLEIVKKLKLDRSTVIRYLKQGVELNWCNYDSKEQMRINGNKGKSNFNGFNFGGFNKKEVYQKTLDGTIVNKYTSISEAHKITGIYHISSCCRGERDLAGGFKWDYVSEYIKSNPLPTAI